MPMRMNSDFATTCSSYQLEEIDRACPGAVCRRAVSGRLRTHVRAGRDAHADAAQWRQLCPHLHLHRKAPWPRQSQAAAVQLSRPRRQRRSNRLRRLPIHRRPLIRRCPPWPQFTVKDGYCGRERQRTDRAQPPRSPSSAPSPGGTQFEISGRNQEYTWFQFCCVAGQTGWIFAQLVNVENAHLITVAQNIPPTPVPPTPTPVPPTATPVPAQVDHCAGIGGDGCKFRLRDQDHAEDGGGVLKLRIGFVHGGRGRRGPEVRWLLC